MSISSGLIEFWCFGLPAALGVGVGGGWLGGASHTCTRMHACACMHIYTLNMIISIANGSPHWGNPWEFPMMSYMCMHACACMHVCGGHPLTTPHPHPPTPHPTGGDPWNQSKFNSTWTNRDISILFEDLKSVETSQPMGGCIVWWVGWWVGSSQNTKNLKNVDWIKIIQFCLKIYDL